MDQQQSQQSQQPQPQPQPQQPPKKKHTGLIVVLIILAVLILGGLISCAACGAAVNKTIEGSKASNVTGGSTGTASSAQSAAVLYDANGITVKATERGVKYGMAYYTIETTNTTSQNIDVSIDNVSANGTMIKTFFYQNVAAGKTSKEELQFSDVHDMDMLVNVEGSIKIVNHDNFKMIAQSTFAIS